MVDETRNSVSGQARVDTVVQTGSVGELHIHGGAEADPGITASQLPPGAAHFVNREGEQAAVVRVAGERSGAAGAGEGRPLVVAVHGMRGVGKTALGVRLARALAGESPDALRFVDLDDHRRDGGVETAEVLGELLRSLGVRPEWVEAGYAGRRRQYWARTGDRRLVLVVDNVRFAVELEQLMPASAGSVVIAISQGRLDDLKGGADLEIPLGPLGDEHAAQLLRAIADDPRLSGEPAAAEALARVCGGLPAALEVAGEWLRKHRRRRLLRLVAQLTDEWTERGIPMVEAVWDAAYGDLGPAAARLYRLLAVHPGPYPAPEAVTALFGEGADAAEDALEELERASLLLPGRGGRPGMHDLLRAHAVRCVRRDGGEAEAAGARGRLIRWYLRQAQRADALAAGPRMRFAGEVSAVEGAPDVEFGPGKQRALRWMESERLALFGCVRAAYACGMDAEAWALCEPLWTHFLDHAHYGEVTEAFRTGRDAAQRAGHIAALVRMRCQLARPLWEQGRYEEAETEVGLAVSAARLSGGPGGSETGETGGTGDTGDTGGLKLWASALEFRGKVRSVQGDWAAAVPDFEESRRIHTRIRNPYGVLLQTHLLGQAAAALGEPDRAAALLAGAHAMAREQRRERMTARTGFELGRVLQGLARREEAAELYAAALDGARERGSGTDEVRILDALASLAAESGDAEQASAHRESAREIREREGGLPFA
ncbi:NB-ARC domain-containing protein [Streptomyces sp. NBC_00388]|uniref:NB-ARC domain-containing protein n=1 Tax=Streptomyces sp. NBC_00388 TaxID=2975735 RepID=UPI002E22B721